MVKTLWFTMNKGRQPWQTLTFPPGLGNSATAAGVKTIAVVAVAAAVVVVESIAADDNCWSGYLDLHLKWDSLSWLKLNKTIILHKKVSKFGNIRSTSLNYYIQNLEQNKINIL